MPFNQLLMQLLRETQNLVPPLNSPTIETQIAALAVSMVPNVIKYVL
jgi:hypothetical protein